MFYTIKFCFTFINQKWMEQVHFNLFLDFPISVTEFCNGFSFWEGAGQKESTCQAKLLVDPVLCYPVLLSNICKQAYLWASLCLLYSSSSGKLYIFCCILPLAFLAMLADLPFTPASRLIGHLVRVSIPA